MGTAMSRRWRAPIGATMRMAGGSALGIIGFGILSLGFEQLNGQLMGLGVLSIAVGTFLALGVMAPLRRRRSPKP
jgi:hypothetical protein